MYAVHTAALNLIIYVPCVQFIIIAIFIVVLYHFYNMALNCEIVWVAVRYHE
jgi:hypothetical protein